MCAGRALRSARSCYKFATGGWSPPVVRINFEVEKSINRKISDLNRRWRYIFIPLEFLRFYSSKPETNN